MACKRTGRPMLSVDCSNGPGRSGASGIRKPFYDYGPVRRLKHFPVFTGVAAGGFDAFDLAMRL